MIAIDNLFDLIGLIVAVILLIESFILLIFCISAIIKDKYKTRKHENRLFMNALSSPKDLDCTKNNSSINAESNYSADIQAKELSDKYRELFLNTVKYEEIEDIFYSKSELLYAEILSKYGYVLSSNFINAIYGEIILKNDMKALLSILNIISDVETPDEMTSYFAIVISSMRINNAEIVDKAISCFRKWGRKEDADRLSNFEQPSEKWLARYYNDTIDYLRGL